MTFFCHYFPLLNVSPSIGDSRMVVRLQLPMQSVPVAT